jgi:hypothetical protein
MSDASTPFYMLNKNSCQILAPCHLYKLRRYAHKSNSSSAIHLDVEL